MNKTEAKRLVAELKSLIGDYPGKNEYRFKRCREIVSDLTYNQSDAYLREKASTALEFLGYWFSPRKWQQWGSAERMHMLVYQDVTKLEYALEEHFRES